jgi:hypothetical protein
MDEGFWEQISFLNTWRTFQTEWEFMKDCVFIYWKIGQIHSNEFLYRVSAALRVQVCQDPD